MEGSHNFYKCTFGWVGVTFRALWLEETSEHNETGLDDKDVDNEVECVWVPGEP